MTQMTTSFQWGADLAPVVLRAGRFALNDRDFQATYSGPTHSLHAYDYHADMDLGGERIRLAPGDCTLSPAGGQTRYHLDQPGHHWCVHFTPMAGDTALGNTCTLPLHFPLGPLWQRVAETVARMASLLASAHGNPVPLAAASHAFQDLLLTVAWERQRQNSQRAGRADAAADQAAQVLTADLLNPPSISAVAHRVGLSQTHLARAFRARHGMTAARYLLARRIEEAGHLLQSTDLPVGRIAERLGFADSQHFNKLFRRVMGCSPSDHRVQARGG